MKAFLFTKLPSSNERNDIISSNSKKRVISDGTELPVYFK